MYRPALAWKAGLQALPVTLSHHLVNYFIHSAQHSLKLSYYLLTCLSK